MGLLLARHSHYGNERGTRRKMTVVVRPRGYTHMAKIDHFEGLFRQLWTRVFSPNKLIWKARNERNPFLQKNRCHLQTAKKVQLLGRFFKLAHGLSLANRVGPTSQQDGLQGDAGRLRTRHGQRNQYCCTPRE